MTTGKHNDRQHDDISMTTTWVIMTRTRTLASSTGLEFSMMIKGEKLQSINIYAIGCVHSVTKVQPDTQLLNLANKFVKHANQSTEATCLSYHNFFTIFSIDKMGFCP